MSATGYTDEQRAMLAWLERKQQPSVILEHLSRLQGELASVKAAFDGSTYEERVALYAQERKLGERIAEASAAYRLVTQKALTS